MPIYEYQCQQCGHHFEKLQSLSAAPLKTCPKCEKECLQKLVSSSAFQLKGTGWYVTDFKDKGKKKPEVTKDNTKKEIKPDTKSDTKSDTK